MEYKLIAIDLDDTLLRNDLTISERAQKAISTAIEKGTLVTFATGRMYCSALPYALDLGLDLPLITYQGALVKYADGREVYHRPIELEIAKEVIRFTKPFGIHTNAYINDELYMEEATGWGKQYAKIAKAPVHYVELPNTLEQDPTKILFIDESDKLDELAEKIAQKFPKVINITKSQKTFLEISHPKATKGNALRELAESLGINRQQVIAIGDNMNDLDMIEYAGCGVAVGNAVTPLKDAADLIVKSNNDDGVAEAIENLVLKFV
ncbi:MAG: Cof-type HAD-IIB family hydrolase [Peptococcales bacterium]|jgi:Cof subfamily protein (haloacid dehalogenase superfamily)